MKFRTRYPNASVEDVSYPLQTTYVREQHWDLGGAMFAQETASLRIMLFNQHGSSHALNLKQEAARLRALERKLETLAAHPDTSEEHRIEIKLRLNAVRSEIQMIQEEVA